MLMYPWGNRKKPGPIDERKNGFSARTVCVVLLCEETGRKIKISYECVPYFVPVFALSVPHRCLHKR